MISSCSILRKQTFSTKTTTQREEEEEDKEDILTVLGVY